MIIKISDYDRYLSKQAKVEFLDVVDASKEIIETCADAEVTSAIGANRIDVSYSDDRNDVIYIADNFNDFSFMRICCMIREGKLKKSA